VKVKITLLVFKPQVRRTLFRYIIRFWFSGYALRFVLSWKTHWCV